MVQFVVLLTAHRLPQNLQPRVRKKKLILDIRLSIIHRYASEIKIIILHFWNLILDVFQHFCRTCFGLNHYFINTGISF